MDGKEMLLAQLGAAIEDLTRAKAAVHDPRVPQRYRERVESRFNRRIANLEEFLYLLEEQVQGGAWLEGYWERFEQKQPELSFLFRESLAFLEGALLRGAELDGGICDLSDSLLDEISNKAELLWAKLTLLAEDEYITSMTDIIRLRFPRFSVWELPIAAHELGHIACQEVLQQVKPDLFCQILEMEGFALPPSQKIEDIRSPEEKAKAERQVKILTEQFADLFAIYTLGPAYACSCLLRFSPAANDQDGLDHPAEANRVHFMLKALRMLDQEDRNRPQMGFLNRIETTWQQSRESANRTWPLEKSVTIPLDNRLQTMYLQAVKPRFINARFKEWTQATRLNQRIMEEGYGPGVAGAEQYSLPVVLNAAWQFRIQHLQDGDKFQRKIDECALLWARSAMKKHADQEEHDG